MKRLKENLKKYLHEVVGLKIKTQKMDFLELPYYFTDKYTLHQLKIGDVVFTAIFLKDPDNFKPSQFTKQIKQIPSINSKNTCVIAYDLPSYVRKRMIEHRIAFVVPSVQMYLPLLGMELRSRSKPNKPMLLERFSPATQVVLIHFLLGRQKGPVTPLKLSQDLFYSSMTMSRAIKELESSEIVYIQKNGKERLVTFKEDPRKIWGEVISLCRNPVSQEVRVFKKDVESFERLKAGVTALSLKTMIGEPNTPEYAVSREAFKEMKKNGLKETPYDDYGTCLIQVWCYDPKVLEVGACVDPFSLYLSLQNENDERIEMALDEIMEQYL